MHNELIRKPLGIKYGHIVTWEDNCTSHCSTIMNEVMNIIGNSNSNHHIYRYSKLYCILKHE